MDEWIDHTSIGDQIEIQYHTRTGRYRWRIKMMRLGGERFRFEQYDEPWSQADVPPNLRPRWMKGRNING